MSYGSTHSGTYLDQALSYRPGNRKENSQKIVKKNKDLAGLRQEKGVHDKALESARADQTNARCDAEGEEYKKAEKVLGSKVLLF